MKTTTNNTVVNTTTSATSTGSIITRFAEWFMEPTALGFSKPGLTAAALASLSYFYCIYLLIINTI